MKKDEKQDDDWEKEFDSHVINLGRKTGFDGKKNIHSYFGYKTEIDWTLVKSFISKTRKEAVLKTLEEVEEIVKKIQDEINNLK